MTRVVHVELEPDDICGRRSRTMCGVVVESERCDGSATCKRCLAVTARRWREWVRRAERARALEWEF